MILAEISYLGQSCRCSFFADRRETDLIAGNSSSLDGRPCLYTTLHSLEKTDSAYSVELLVASAVSPAHHPALVVHSGTKRGNSPHHRTLHVPLAFCTNVNAELELSNQNKKNTNLCEN